MIKFFGHVGKILRHFGTFWHLRRAVNFLVIDVVLLGFVRRRPSNVVLVVRVDLLGDYMIGRKFLRLAREYGPYRNDKIILCANVALSGLIEAYDHDAFDGFIWVDRRALLNEFWYRFRLLRQIKEAGARIVIHPMRDPYLGDCLVRASAADERIGVECREDPDPAPGDLRRRHTTLGDRFYTRLVPDTHQVSFEFERNLRFFGAVLPGVSLPVDTRLMAKEVPLPEVPEPFAVLMPGASDAFRVWPPERFARLALHLWTTRGLTCVVVGGADDQTKAEAIQRAAPDVPMQIFCGELSLSQVIFLLSRCEIGITNDSGGIHVLASLDRPGVAISNTFSFGWFHPYPQRLRPSVSYVYPPAVYAASLSRQECLNRYGRQNLYAVTDVSTEAVTARVDAMLDRRIYEDPIQAACV